MKMRDLINIILENSEMLSANGEELPEVVYHGTCLSTWENSIKHQGLRLNPAEDPNDPDEVYNTPFIFLAWSINGARYWAPGGPISTHSGPGAILSVRLTPELAKKCRTDLGEFLRCTVPIPASHLSLIEITNQ